MGVVQWSVRVKREKGEEKRRALLESGFLDRSLRIRVEGDQVILPVTAPLEDAGRDEFEPLGEITGLPRHELIGGIAIMPERDGEGAMRLLSSRPSLHTVLHPLGPVDGEYRTKRFEVLAGIPTARTLYTEYGRRYQIDLEHAYFSARLAEERQRLSKLVERGEKVLDMFSGVGPVAITLSERAGIVFASDINPVAVHLLILNIKLNRVKNVVPIMANASHLHLLLPQKFDRIVMNLPMSTPAFIDTARAICAGGGVIHFYVLQSETHEFSPFLEGRGLLVLDERKVHTYSPGRWLAVYDLSCP
ncbi:MAG: methyltransferase [Methanomicrobiales archaeon]|nr:methyltransferase [Methanomicrobiales archaeon]